MDSIDDCAEACKGQASMFAFGTNDFGVDRCEDSGSKCLCETSARADGTCDVVEHKGYRLYRFSAPGKYRLRIILIAKNINKNIHTNGDSLFNFYYVSTSQ